jgi:hypothetical protein
MTPSQIIAEVRQLVQDTRAPFRYADSVLLGFVNQTIRRTAMIRPDLFAQVADFATVPNEVLQSCPADSIRLIEIFRVKDGASVIEVNKETLDRSSPNWQNAPAGQPLNFMRHSRNANKFFVYPRPAAGVQLVGEYAQIPPIYTINQTLLYPIELYFSAIISGVVFLTESVDDEHVNSNRAKMFQEMYIAELGADLEASRQVKPND